MKLSDAVPLPDAYGAALDAPLTSRASVGAVPEYRTGSSKLAVMLIVLPAPYAPSGVADVTLAMLGPLASTAMLLECASDPGSPGRAGSVRFAAFPARSAMAPARAFVAL